VFSQFISENRGHDRYDAHSSSLHSQHTLHAILACMARLFVVSQVAKGQWRAGNAADCFD
jgi:hypothetical protein